MKLGMVVGLGPATLRQMGPSSPPKKRGHTPNFRSMSIMAKRLDAQDITCYEVRLDQGDIVLDEDPASP